MTAAPFSRRVVVLIGLGVALPALLLATLGAFLTLRISAEIERESEHYNEYIAHKVSEEFGQELLAHVRSGVGVAENAARSGAPIQTILAALRVGTSEFADPEFVPVEYLDGYSLLIIEGQPLLYARGEGRREGEYFVGALLRDAEGQVIGSGGWWIEPARFISEHLGDVVQERLPGSPRMYGGLAATRRLSMQFFAPDGREIGRVRDPHTGRSAEIDSLPGPLARYVVRVSPASNAPVVWTGRFVTLQLAFIGLMILATAGASVFGLRYLLRQLELAQIKSSFVSNVSHELKTPIALIRLAVETLEMGRATRPEEREKFVHIIGRETARLSQLVDNILDFARLEAGQKIFRFERVDVVDLVRTTLESFRLRLEDQGFAVSVDLPDSLPAARADATALTHCLLNLLDNAIKYSRDRRDVRVSAGTRPGFVTVSVGDRGVGIAPGDQRRIFEKFVRVETGLVHDVKGAGLGLSLVDQIIRAHGGRVEVMSAPGEGSTFTLLIPAADEDEAAGARPPAGA